jgi:hypothetical protein
MLDDRADSLLARRFIEMRRCRKHRGSTMKSTGQLGLFQLVLVAGALLGCASAADDSTLPPSDEATASDSQGLKGVAAPGDDLALDADAADCDGVAPSAGVRAGSFAEFNSILESSRVDLDSPEALANTCTRVCKCCDNNGNRFCCSHCRLCSGPIGVIDGVLAP